MDALLPKKGLRTPSPGPKSQQNWTRSVGIGGPPIRLLIMSRSESIPMIETEVHSFIP